MTLFASMNCAQAETSRAGRREPSSAQHRPLDGFYEPSGITQLDDGRLVIVEDEPRRPFGMMTPDESPSGFQISRLGGLVAGDWLKGGLDDLEAISRGPDGWLYAITSHSRKANGKRAPDRERLLRFRVEGQRVLDLEVIADLRKTIVKAYPELEEAGKERRVKRKAGLNIEGLAFDPRSGRLWVGLRGPLVDDRALLLAITNSGSAFGGEGEIQLASEPVELDLDGGGIRDLAYAPSLGGILVLSQKDQGKKEKPSKLWLWDGEPAQVGQVGEVGEVEEVEEVEEGGRSVRRVRLQGIEDLGNAEGVAEVQFRGSTGLVVVFDDGNRKKKESANYLLVDQSQLEIEGR